MARSGLRGLEATIPETQFDFINAGIPSLGSTPGAFRFQQDVWGHGTVDLLFEEAAVNDDTNGFSSVEQIRGMEGIVRQARLANPNIDIVLLHFVDPGKIDQINRGETPVVIANHEKVADQYRIPSNNLAWEVTERIMPVNSRGLKTFAIFIPRHLGTICMQNRLLVCSTRPGMRQRRRKQWSNRQNASAVGCPQLFSWPSGQPAGCNRVSIRRD